MEFFATCPPRPRGAASPTSCARSARATSTDARRGGVAFTGTLEIAYRACLWSRVASRVLLPLAQLRRARRRRALRRACATIRWSEHLGADATLAVDFTQSRSAITHTHFGALKVKDAIVDQFRDETGARPVGRHASARRAHQRARRRRPRHVAIDLSGESLHRRGWRAHGRRRRRSRRTSRRRSCCSRGWPARAARGRAAAAIRCAARARCSIEAALIAADRAPGLRAAALRLHRLARPRRAAVAAAPRRGARARASRLAMLPMLRGCDADARAVRRRARRTPSAPACAGRIHRRAARARRRCSALGERAGPGGHQPALRRAPRREPELRAALRAARRRAASGASPAGPRCVLTGEPGAGASASACAPTRAPRAVQRRRIECRLLELPDRRPTAPKRRGPPGASRGRRSARRDVREPAAQEPASTSASGPGARTCSCYRVYDADLPEYAVAVDLYEDAVHVQEYDAARDRRSAERAEQRLRRRDGACCPRCSGSIRETCS